MPRGLGGQVCFDYWGHPTIQASVGEEGSVKTPHILIDTGALISILQQRWVPDRGLMDPSHLQLQSYTGELEDSLVTQPIVTQIGSARHRRNMQYRKINQERVRIEF